MTSLAMIIGMVPMALGLGEGGEQNAPLGRAVIGGLLLATVATLVFVPTVFSLLHRRRHDGTADRIRTTQPMRHEELADMMLKEQDVSDGRQASRGGRGAAAAGDVRQPCR